MNLSQSRKWVTTLLIPAVSGIFSTWSPQVFADEAAVIEEIIVTARKLEENLQDVPAAVSAFSAEMLANSGVDNMVELENVTPNITTNETTGLAAGTLQVFIRGIGNDPGFDQGVGLYVDDVYLNRASGALLDLYDVERVEILKGPQGNLYGRNTIGGAIKYISRLPSEERAGYVEVKTGSDSLVKVKGGVSGALSDRLLGGVSFSYTDRDGYQTNRFDGEEYADEDKVAARGTVIWKATDTVSVKLAADTLQDKSRPIVPNRLAIQLAGAGGLGTNQLLLSGANGFIPGLPPGLPPYPAYLSPTGPLDLSPPASDIDDVNTGHTTMGYERFEIDATTVSLTIDWDINDRWALKSITATRQLDDTIPFDFDGSHQKFINTVYDREHDDFTQEFQLSYAGDRVNAILGLYYMDAEQIINDYTEQRPDLRIFTSRDRDGTDNLDDTSFSIYGNLVWDMSEQWQLSLGGRYTRDEKEITRNADVTITHQPAILTPNPMNPRQPVPLVLNSTFPTQVFAAFPPTAVLGFFPHCATPDNPINVTAPSAQLVCPTQSGLTAFLGRGDQVTVEQFVESRANDDEWTEFTPSVKLAYRANDDMLLYAGFTTGFKSGGFDFSGSETVIPVYEPETVDTVSLGMKSTLAQGRVRLNIELFTNEYTDKQFQRIVLNPTGQLESATGNLGEVTSNGAELELLWLPPVDGLTINLNLGYLDSEVDEFIVLRDDPSGGRSEVDLADTTGLGYSPEDTAQLGITYRFGLAGGNVTIGANGAYRSEMYTQTPVDLSDAFFLNAQSESRTIWNAMIGYTSESDQWRITLEGRNLSDERSLVNTFDIPNFMSGGYLRGRHWGLSVRYDL